MEIRVCWVCHVSCGDCEAVWDLPCVSSCVYVSNFGERAEDTKPFILFSLFITFSLLFFF